MTRRTFLLLFGACAAPLAAGPNFIAALVQRRNARRPVMGGVAARTARVQFDGTDDCLTPEEFIVLNDQERRAVDLYMIQHYG
jgi:hypothetical protein